MRWAAGLDELGFCPMAILRPLQVPGSLGEAMASQAATRLQSFLEGLRCGSLNQTFQSLKEGRGRKHWSRVALFVF